MSDMFSDIVPTTKWKFRIGDGKGQEYSIFDRNTGVEVCRVTGSNAKERAEFIVRACESHDELLVALKGVLEWARRAKVLNPGMEILQAMTAIDHAEGSPNASNH